MTGRPILFSGPMVRALLSGRKTQTRRIAPRWKVSPGGSEWNTPGATVFSNGVWHTWDKDGVGGENDTEDTVERAKEVAFESAVRQGFVSCPYGQPGDLLYVRERWAELEDYAGKDPGSDALAAGCFYAADYPEGDKPVRRWRAPFHLKRVKTRLTLRIKSVRVERLHEITEADAIAEGIDPLFTAAEAKSRPELNIEPMPWLNYLWHGNRSVFGLSFAQIDAWEHQSSSYKTAAGSYSSLWESINGIGSWAENPWVWVVKFEVIKSNVDQVLKEAA